MQTPQVFVIIPAAGKGSRMGTSIAKQFIQVGDKPILAYACDKFLAWGKTTQILVGLANQHDFIYPQVTTYQGGKERADTVLLGLQALQSQANDNDWILVHDAARPLVNIKDLDKLFDNLQNDKVGGILTEQATSTVKQVTNGVIDKTLPREQIYLAQTPQMFRFGILLQALEKADSVVTDEASAVEQLGLAVKIIKADHPNPKLTYQSDLDYINFHLKRHDNEY